MKNRFTPTAVRFQISPGYLAMLLISLMLVLGLAGCALPGVKIPLPESSSATPTPFLDGFLQGKDICFVSERDGNYEIFTIAEDGSNLTNLTRNEFDDGFPSWSRSAGLMAFASTRDGNSEIYLIDLNAAPDANGNFPVTRLTNNDGVDSYPALSPDGKKVAFVSDRSGNKDIYLMNADGSELVDLTNDPSEDNFPVFSPDGSRIAFASNRDGNFDIYIMNAGGSKMEKITTGSDNKGYPSWSPNGNQLAFSAFIGNNEVYIINADGSGVRDVSNDPASDRNPSWSSDGQRLVFVSDRTGNAEIFTIGINGDGLRRITNHPAIDTTPHFLK